MLPTDDFIAWAGTRGIVFDTRYSPPRCLVREGDPDESRWWDLPTAPREISRLLSCLLTGMGPWSTCLLWRRGGSWFDVVPPRNRLEASRQTLAMGPAIPDGFQGAVTFSTKELPLMVGLVMAHVIAGWCVDDDIFVIPNDGRFIVQTDHHGVVHASCRDRADMNRLIEHMTKGGYTLPDEPRDWTFKRPDWME
jgi:hypothetical protein